jgi:hypothetical protein
MKLAPVVVEDAVTLTVVTEQVKVAGAAIERFGAVIFWFTDTQAVAVQPLAGSVIVTQ